MLVPLFHDDTNALGELARRADNGPLDGLFVFDNQPREDRPVISYADALRVLLDATERCLCGSLVARVDSALEDGVVDLFAGLHAGRPGRVLAGLGVGDRAVLEKEFPGRGVEAFEGRLRALESAVRRLKAASVPVWVGGRSQAVQGVAERCEVSRNLWEPPSGELTRAVGRGEAVTWAGRVDLDDAELRSTLLEQRAAGAEWAVVMVRGSRANPQAALDALASAVAVLD